MKRIKSACIFQTLTFSQKPDFNLSKERVLKINHEEFENYKKSLERSKTKYQIDNVSEQTDGSLVVSIRKQYNSTADVSAYFK